MNQIAGRRATPKNYLPTRPFQLPFRLLSVIVIRIIIDTIIFETVYLPVSDCPPIVLTTVFDMMRQKVFFRR